MNFFRKKISAQKQETLDGLDLLSEATDVVTAALQDEDHEKAHESLSILLMICTTLYGLDHPVMGHYFPALDVIKRRIDSMDLEGALLQSKLFRSQLAEVRQIILQS